MFVVRFYPMMYLFMSVAFDVASQHKSGMQKIKVSQTERNCWNTRVLRISKSKGIFKQRKDTEFNMCHLCSDNLGVKTGDEWESKNKLSSRKIQANNMKTNCEMRCMRRGGVKESQWKTRRQS